MLRSPSVLIAVALVNVSSLGLGCGHDFTQPPGSTGGAAGASGGGGAGGFAGALNPPRECHQAGDALYPSLRLAGLERGFTLEFLEISPPIPRHGSSANYWKVKLTEPNGAPLTGVTVEILVEMPEHGHPGVPTAGIENGDGVYTIDRLTLAMPGFYLIAVNALRGTTLVDSVRLRLCPTGSESSPS